jgi:hypothetical protein
VPEWSKGAVCKTAGSAYVGSSPTSPIVRWKRCRRGFVQTAAADLHTCPSALPRVRTSRSPFPGVFAAMPNVSSRKTVANGRSRAFHFGRNRAKCLGMGKSQVALRDSTMRSPTRATLAHAAEHWLAGAKEDVIRTRSGEPYSLRRCGPTSRCSVPGPCQCLVTCAFPQLTNLWSKGWPRLPSENSVLPLRAILRTHRRSWHRTTRCRSLTSLDDAALVWTI